MDNLKVYEAVRQPPAEALREIKGGRLAGKTDINPMWRLKVLTEQFGMCGIGWKYVITKQWLETGGKDEIAAFVNIDLFVKVEGEWSAAIPGTGGSSFVAAETRGLYTSDECYKMALTDAFSVACKALGFAANIYWDKDNTKYDRPDHTPQEPRQPMTQQEALKPTETMQSGTSLKTETQQSKPTTTTADGKCQGCGNTINNAIKTFSEKKFGKPLCMICQKKEGQTA